VCIFPTPTTVERVKSGWITCAALAAKCHFTTVLTVAGEFTTAIIVKTCQFAVSKVHLYVTRCLRRLFIFCITLYVLYIQYTLRRYHAWSRTKDSLIYRASWTNSYHNKKTFSSFSWDFTARRNYWCKGFSHS